MSQADLSQSGSIDGNDFIDAFLEPALAALATGMAGATPPTAAMFGGTIPTGALWLDTSSGTGSWVLRAWDPASSPGDWVAIGASGGSSVVGTAGESLAAADFVYQDVYNQRGGGATKWYKIDADATGPVKISPRRGFTVAAIGSSSTGLIIIGHAATVAGLSGLTAGAPVWGHASTAGAVTATEPAIPSNGTQVAVVRAGIALNTTALAFDAAAAVDFVAYAAGLTNGSTATVEHWTDDGARERRPAAYVTASAGGLVSNGTGSAIGNMTANGGLAAARDNVTVGDSGAAAACTSTTIGAVGVDWGANATKSIASVTVNSTTNVGFASSAANVTIDLVGNSVNNVSNGTVLGTTGSIADSNHLSVNITASNTSAFRYHWTKLTVGSSDNVFVVEQTFYELTATREEPAGPVVSDTLYASGVAIPCKFSDASDANCGTKTTFRNRLGATKDLTFSVRLE